MPSLPARRAHAGRWGPNAKHAALGVVSPTRCKEIGLHHNSTPHGQGDGSYTLLSGGAARRRASQQRRRTFLNKKRVMSHSRTGNMPQRCNVNVSWCSCRPWFYIATTRLMVQVLLRTKQGSRPRLSSGKSADPLSVSPSFANLEHSTRRTRCCHCFSSVAP